MTEGDDIIDNIKGQLYELYIDIKTCLIPSEKLKIKHANKKEISSTTEPLTIINYLKDCIQILIDQKMIENEVNEKNNLDNQLESYMQKLENDLKYSLKNQFIYKIQRDSLELKIKGYMEIQDEYEELKEKLKYENGKFLNNDRKENEIIILRRENSNLKKEINKVEEKYKLYERKYNDDEDCIKGLKFKVAQLNKKIEELKEEINNIKMEEINKNKSNSITELYNNIVRNKNKPLEKISLDKININNINNFNGGNNNKMNLHLKRDLTNYQLQYNNYNNYESSKSNSQIKALNTIDSNNKLIITTFNRIYNNKSKIAPIRNNKFNNVKKNKSNSMSKRSEENEKKSELMGKYITGSNHGRNEKKVKIRSLSKINKNTSTYILPPANHNFFRNHIQKENIFEHSTLNGIGLQKLV